MKETYIPIFKDGDPVTVRNNRPAVFTFSADGQTVVDKRQRLFFKGESALFYLWRSEPDCIGEYACIDDSLTKENTHTDLYCLDYSSETPVRYRKTAYKKLAWPPIVSYLPAEGVYTDTFLCGIFASAKDLVIEPDGFLTFSVEVFYKTNTATDFMASSPNETHVFVIDGGTYDFKQYKKEIQLSYGDISHVDFILSGEKYKGEVYFEHPFLEGESLPNLLPDFAPIMPSHEKWAWTGINLSKKEWPQFRIVLNGTEVFDGELFEKCHRYSDFELSLPIGAIQSGQNTLEIHTKEGYELPFKIAEVGYFCQRDGEVCIEGCPHTVHVGKTAKLLIRTKRDGVTVTFESGSPKIRAVAQTFETAGLHVFEIEVLQSGVDIAFCLSGIPASFACAIEKADDGVTVGTGDMIYINHEDADQVDAYLAWYMRNEIGNLFTIRNVYRWGGGRRLDTVIWEKTAALLNALDMKYVHMVDGRDLPGAYCNPSLDTLAGKGFLGRQGHEYDGQFGYWGSKDLTADLSRIAIEEMWGRIPREHTDIMDPRHNQTTLVREDGKTYLYKKPKTASDMQTAHDRTVAGLRNTRLDMTRHTGPATWFKYLYEAGYDWVGAELMYSSYEILSAALRGANYGYGKDKMGAHLAVQWSTTPHDDDYRYRRFRLALYLAYLNGYTDINTEEGLWHLEEFYSSFSRNSEACRSHMKQQQDFYRFLSLNERRGEYQAPFAFVSGRYDGWNAFSEDAVWGQQNFKCSDCEKSWILLEEFYPLSMQSSSYRHPCPIEPIGHYSGTPHGNVDIVPIETHRFDKYQVLCFAGYHKMDPADCDALLSYMQKGGRVIMGRCHLAVTTDRAAVETGKLDFLQHELTEIIDSHRNGEAVLMIPIGEGELTFIDREEYPAHAAVDPLYRAAIRRYRDQIQHDQPIQVTCDESVQYAIYRDGTAYDVYLLAVDWYAKESYNRQATLNGTVIRFPFGRVVKARVQGDVLAYTDCENAVVVSVLEDAVVVRGYGSGNVTIVKAGEETTYPVCFTNDSCVTVVYQ